MPTFNAGKVVPIDIKNEMENSFLDYAMSVIVSRALPDVRDGLKPVHRRILYAMYDLGITPDKSHKKSARVVGEVLGKYHPHGDVAVYDAMVRMAQDFSTRYPLVDGHGNFGSIDGDRAAAMRYTEVKMEKISNELLRDIDKDTIDFQLNFDETLNEPKVIPSKFPNLLVNGSSGIAVGMATNIPPHNLAESIDGLVALIDNPDLEIRELMEYIQGPDFPTGGQILGTEGIHSAYKTGRGKIKIRAKTKIEELKGNKHRIIVNELPYQVNKAKLIESIASLVRDKRIEGVGDLRDESDRDGLRIVIELKRDVNPDVLLNQLFKYTALEQSYGIIMLALVEGEPKVLNLRQVLDHYLEYQKIIIIRRTKYLLRKAEARAHILEGLRIALNNLDAIIKLIRGSENVSQAKTGLMNNFSLSDKQAQAILDMRLQKLTGLERDKVEQEYKELLEKINYYKKVLADENLIMNIIKKELLEIKDKYADDRRTIVTKNLKELDEEDMIPDEEVIITLTHQGYIKRVPVSTYRSQKRGGRGISGITTKEDDFVEHLFVTSTHNHILFFTNKGKMYRQKVYEIPEASRQARGTAIVNLLSIDSDEYINAVIPIKEFTDDRFLFFVTQKGIVKKTALKELKTARRKGLIALTLLENDELMTVRLTDGEQEIVLGTKQGIAIRFLETDVRSMGRVSRGVKGISLASQDEIIGMDIVEDGSQLLIVSEHGYGKITDLSEYRVQTRGGKGIYTFKMNNRTGKLAGCRVVDSDSDVIVVTASGVIIRQHVTGISKMSRRTQGVRLIRLDNEDWVVSMAISKTKEESPESDEN